jgi:hypothetical protein
VLAQEVEVAAAVGLQDFAAVEKGVAALGNRRRGDRAARPATTRHFGKLDVLEWGKIRGETLDLGLAQPMRRGEFRAEPAS